MKPAGVSARGGAAMLVLGWLIAVGLVFWYFHGFTEREANPNPKPEVTAAGDIVLKRNRAGHYVAGGEINGERVTFLLDTGATQVALPMALAKKLSLALGHPVQLQTAAGPARSYTTRLKSVRLASIEVTDVGALVAEGLDPDIVLLGMNFLRRLELVQRGDELILREATAAAR